MHVTAVRYGTLSGGLELLARAQETVRQVWLQFAPSFPLQGVWLGGAQGLGAAPT